MSSANFAQKPGSVKRIVEVGKFTFGWAGTALVIDNQEIKIKGANADNSFCCLNLKNAGTGTTTQNAAFITGAEYTADGLTPIICRPLNGGVATDAVYELICYKYSE